MELLIQVIALFCTEIEWVPEERITLFTSDGLVQIGGNMVPRRIKSSHVCKFHFIVFDYHTFLCLLAWNVSRVQKLVRM